MESVLENVDVVSFSPTGTTHKVVAAIAKNVAQNIQTNIDLTFVNKNTSETIFLTADIVVIGAPVYKGRLPEEAVDRLQKIKGNGQPAVVVAVYGNREFDDALVELTDLVTELNFNVISAATFIGEHSFSTKEKPLSPGRPDEKDLLKAKEFAGQIRKSLSEVAAEALASELSIPGSRPYKEHPPAPLIAPDTEDGNCNLCGECIEVCPTQAISMDSEIKTDPNLCIWCCACVKECPSDGRIFNHSAIENVRNFLIEKYSDRKEPEFFLPKI